MNNESQGKLVSFRDFLGENQVVIPKIQRDYAQGRDNDKIQRVRKDFLDTLFNALNENKSLELDFVYGSNTKGKVELLDGQQRLTTLFLLHCYAVIKENSNYTDFLKSFSYETRIASRMFCKNLTENLGSITIDIDKNISDSIIDQSWFMIEWQNDPTIKSMLTMLDAIHKKARENEDIKWSNLNKIKFYFLEMKDMGLSDELYIKMNSRGKPLSDFENLKAKLIDKIEKLKKEESYQKLSDDDKKNIKEIPNKIDNAWTDMFWGMQSKIKEIYDNKKDKSEKFNIETFVDNAFLRYFKFICAILHYTNNKNYENEKDKKIKTFDDKQDYISLLENYFNDNKNSFITLYNYFDCWCEFFLKDNQSSEKEKNKDRFEQNFVDCLCKDNFNIGEIIYLYAKTEFLLQEEPKMDIQKFKERVFRIIKNLVENSRSGEIRNEYMPTLLAQTKSIVKDCGICVKNTNTKDYPQKTNFNTYQIAEEIAKWEWLKENNNFTNYFDRLVELESHELLYGQIAILNPCLKNDENSKTKFINTLSVIFDVCLDKKFLKLFNKELFTEMYKQKIKERLDKIDCALMAIDFYPQKATKDKDGIIYKFASSNPNKEAWKNLFHSSSNDFKNTSKYLINLLNECDNDFTNEKLENIANEYCKTECEDKDSYPFNYYYIKYKAFRADTYGKPSEATYHNVKKDNIDTYMWITMLTGAAAEKRCYSPYLLEVFGKTYDYHSSSNPKEKSHKTEKYTISVIENGFEIKGEEDNIDTLLQAIRECKLTNVSFNHSNKNQDILQIIISQNDKGIDRVDRVFILKLLNKIIQKLNQTKD